MGPQREAAVMFLMILAIVVVVPLLASAWMWDQKKRHSQRNASDAPRIGVEDQPAKHWWFDRHGGPSGGW